jgi:prepilin-type N-terminal cleavage/methylation domain-containing protein
MGPFGHPSARRQSGFTLVEVMIAMSILLVGVLGVVGTVDVANRQSATNNGRDGATAVTRRVLEVARDLPYSSLQQTNFASLAQARAADLQTVAAGTWKVKRGGFEYTISTSICAVDDPADGTDVHPTQDPPFCAVGAASTTPPPDDQPDDYRRVTTTTTWNVGTGDRTLTQATLIGAPGNQHLPAVKDVKPASGPVPAPPVTSQAVTSLPFNVTTTNNPATLSWLVDDDVKGSCPPATPTCSGSGNSWNFTWSLGTPVLDTNSSSLNYGKCIAGNYTYDGTYQVGARAFDDDGVAGPRGSTPQVINRCAPIPPPSFNATGRNAATPIIDIEWNKNPEGDILGYRVYRATTPTNGVQVCPATAGQYLTGTESCVDPSPPTYSGAWFYAAVAGNPIAVLNADGTVTLTWATASGSGDPDNGDYVDSYRIYRRPAGATLTPTYLNRYDYETAGQLCNGTSTCKYTDKTPLGVSHVYTVTAVDSHLFESNYTANVTR